MLVTLNEILKMGEERGCAIGAFNTPNLECITPVFETYDPLEMAASGYAIVPYITPGKYVCYAFSFTGGALVDW